MNSTRCIVFDLETTGFSAARGDRIIEVGAISIEGGKFRGEFHSLIDAGCRIPPAAQRVHGITRDMLCGHPRPEEVWPDFGKLIRGSTLVAHNAAFDMSFLRHEFGRLGLSLPNRCCCTLQISRKAIPGLANYQLCTVARHLFGRVEEQDQLHRALVDARLTARVWLALKRLE